MTRIAVLDIGGTAIKVGVFTDGVLEEKEGIATNAKRGAKFVVEDAVKLLESLRPFDAVGISTCGQVNAKDGSIFYANENMPGYTGTQLKKIMEDRFRVPVGVMNDVYAASSGEKYFGAAQGKDDFACITIGTGIGAGLFLHGKPYYGNGYNAGVMIGGMVIDTKKNTSSWEGTFESCASTTALIKEVNAYDPSIHNGRELFAKLDSDPSLRNILDEWTKRIASGLVSLVAVLNLPCIILGGGIMEQPLVYSLVKKHFDEVLIDGFKNTEIIPAKLGNTAGLYGAYAIAKELL